MTKRRATVLAIGGILIVAGLVGSHWQSELIGWWRGEAKYKGRYTNSWRAELRQWEPAIGVSSLGHTDHFWMRRPSHWERWLTKLFPNSASSSLWCGFALFRGDPEAVPVLIELMRAPECHVRLIAVEALEDVDPSPAEVVPALLAALEDEEPEVRFQARQTLMAIKSSAR